MKNKRVQLEVEKCGNCRYFHNDPFYGEKCRRHAPRIIEHHNGPRSEFPPTYAKYWCGDYERQTKETA